jgi:hypothetical protein
VLFCSGRCVVCDDGRGGRIDKSSGILDIPAKGVGAEKCGREGYVDVEDEVVDPWLVWGGYKVIWSCFLDTS